MGPSLSPTQAGSLAASRMNLRPARPPAGAASPCRRQPAGPDARAPEWRPLPLAERGAVHERGRPGAGHGAGAARADGPIPRGWVAGWVLVGWVLKLVVKLLGGVGGDRCLKAGRGAALPCLALPTRRAAPTERRLPGADARLAGAAGGPGDTLAARPPALLGGCRPRLRGRADRGHGAAGGRGAGARLEGGTSWLPVPAPGCSRLRCLPPALPRSCPPPSKRSECTALTWR